MVWQLLSRFSPFLLACQTPMLLVGKRSATVAEHRNPFCTEQTHKQTKNPWTLFVWAYRGILSTLITETAIGQKSTGKSTQFKTALSLWTTWARKLPANVPPLTVREKTFYCWSAMWFKIPCLCIKKAYKLPVSTLILPFFPCMRAPKCLNPQSPILSHFFSNIHNSLLSCDMVLIAVHKNGKTPAILTHSSTDLNLSLKDFSSNPAWAIFDYYSLTV